VKIEQGIRPAVAFVFRKLVKKFFKCSVLGVLYLYRCTDGGEIWHVPLGRKTWKSNSD